MNELRIAVYPGDGIGPDVIDQATRVLHVVEQLEGNFTLESTHLDWGVNRWRETGTGSSG